MESPGRRVIAVYVEVHEQRADSPYRDQECVSVSCRDEYRLPSSDPTRLALPARRRAANQRSRNHGIIDLIDDWIPDFYTIQSEKSGQEDKSEIPRGREQKGEIAWAGRLARII